ncbi:MAG: sulfite exporter TauE/SafE family protein [Labilithrix sp.]|nr:sulfite exporter TauE/SafE family protein [Labilithrix sp.]MCW5813061.1 sulfite exporter TauE/SafE family protein [Labilithrix sp.]
MTTTMLVAGGLALLIGVVLGMLGGGGAILTLPMLVYVAGVEPKAAIATSLFVVGATSLVGSATHARAKRVRWRIGATFGAAAMGGAFMGGRLARFVPGTALLVAFAVVMLVTAAAMFRGRAGRDGAGRAPAPLRILALGAAVGMLSGLVGAGGGFLIVPALTFFGGLSMREAVGTSLFVITLQSFAGLAGHVGHVEVNWALAALVTGATVTGSLAGAFFGGKVPSEVLRRGFAWLVLAMGIFVLGKQLSLLAIMAMLVAAVDVSALMGGALVGASASLLLLALGRVAGVSGLYGGIFRRGAGDMPLRIAFIAGLLAAGALVHAVHPAAFETTWSPAPVLALAAGLLVGFGTQLGNGCTSGHGVCGLSRLSVRSLVATMTFMLTGGFTVFVVRHILGGGR